MADSLADYGFTRSLRELCPVIDVSAKAPAVEATPSSATPCDDDDAPVLLHSGIDGGDFRVRFTYSNVTVLPAHTVSVFGATVFLSRADAPTAGRRPPPPRRRPRRGAGNDTGGRLEFFSSTLDVHDSA